MPLRWARISGATRTYRAPGLSGSALGSDRQAKPNSLTVRPAETTHLRQRAELVRSLFALS